MTVLDGDGALVVAVVVVVVLFGVSTRVSGGGEAFSTSCISTVIISWLASLNDF